MDLEERPLDRADEARARPKLEDYGLIECEETTGEIRPGPNFPQVQPVNFEDGPVRLDWDTSREPTTAVVEAVAAVTGRPPTALPTLQDSVDTDALNELLKHDSVRLAFDYGSLRVVVDGDGQMTLARPGFAMD